MTFAPVFMAAWAAPSKDASRIQWARDYYHATAPHSEVGGYVNFMGADDDARVRDNYRQNYDRLLSVKKAYDPDNLFHLNQNIS